MSIRRNAGPIRSILCGAVCAVLLAAVVPARADFAAGYAAFQDRDYRVALRALRPEAEAGDKRAQFLLGHMYRLGLGVKKSADEAFAWLSKAAADPDADRFAQFELGVLYDQGQGTKRDLPRAAELYARAAERGVGAALQNLGVMYATGRGVSRDPARALRLFYDAMQAGQSAAAENFHTLAPTVAATPPISGQWQAVDYVAPADDATLRALPESLAPVLGTRVKLARGAFGFGVAQCQAPAYLLGQLPGSALVTSSIGATGLLGLPEFPAGAIPVVEVVCRRGAGASLGVLEGGRLLVAALGGFLVLEPVPSARVADAQRRLNALGYDAGPEDGAFGPRTGKALLAFQAKNGLQRSGTLSELVVERLALSTGS